MRKDEKKIITLILALVIICVIPILIEYFVVNNSFNSNFDNQTWFSFIGSYIGTIITVIIFYTTLRFENKKYREELNRQYNNTLIDKEIDQISKIIKVILLNNYAPILPNINDCLIEYHRFAKDFFEIEFDIEQIGWDHSGKSAKDLLCNLIVKIMTIEGKKLVERSKDPQESFNANVRADLKEMSKLSNEHIHEIKDLYEKYVAEMTQKKYYIGF